MSNYLKQEIKSKFKFLFSAVLFCVFFLGFFVLAGSEKVYAGSPPNVMWDYPTSASTVSGKAVRVSGWSIDNLGGMESNISKFEVFVDGVLVSSSDPASPKYLASLYGNARPDVCGYYWWVWGCPNPPVGYWLDWDSTTVKNGSHIMTVKSTDSDSIRQTTVVDTAFKVANPSPSCDATYSPVNWTTPATSGTTDFYAYHIKDASMVYFATYTAVNSTIWYPGTRVSGDDVSGYTWRGTIDLGAFAPGNPYFGAFHTDVWAAEYGDPGVSTYGCVGINWTRTAPVPTPDLKISTWYVLADINGNVFPTTYNSVNGPVESYLNEPYSLSWGAVPNATSCTLDGVAVPTTAYSINTYTATALNRVHTLTCTNVTGQSASDTVTVTVPPPPTGLAKTSCSPDGTQMTLGWAIPGGYSNSYFRAASASWGYNSSYVDFWSFDPAFQDNNAITSKTITVVPGLSYHVWVHTKNNSNLVWSGITDGNFSCPVPPPPTPTGFWAGPSTCGTGQMNLSWNASPGANTYTVNDGVRVVYSGPALSVSDYGLVDGSSHTYTITASNASGTSASGGTSPTTTVAPPVCTFNSASCTSITSPDNVQVGTTFSATVVMQNNGTKTWQSPAINPSQPYRLGSQNSQDNSRWGFSRVDMPVTSVAPGGSATFTFNAVAPSTVGTYPFEWKMVQDAVEWFGVTCSKTIIVSPAAPACPAGSVSLTSSSINQAQTTTASAPLGFGGGSFVSSNTGVATIPSPLTNPATINGVAGGTSNISGTGWKYDTVWVEDAIPVGGAPASDGGDGWNWVSSSPTPYSGTSAHKSNLTGGMHQHYFTNATSKLNIDAGDTMVAYVYLDPTNPPSEIMMQWDDDSTWSHRAYWGLNNLAWGTDGTNSRRYMGPLPSTGQWIRLEVPASSVGLEGHSIHSMAFSLYDGQASWDHIGKNAGTGNCSLSGSTLTVVAVPTRDLTVTGNVSPTTAVEGNTLTFSAVVAGTPSFTNGETFKNFFQVSTLPFSSGILTDLAPIDVTTTSVNSITITSPSYVFTSPGTYAVRACADKSDRNDAVGVIPESDENNNCGAWTTVTVSPSTSCNPNFVGTNQMSGCSYSGMNFNTLVPDSILVGAVLSSPAPASASPLPFVDWGNAGPLTVTRDVGYLTDNFSVRWKGKFNFLAGNYVFSTNSDDGSRAYFDDNNDGIPDSGYLVNDWSDHGPRLTAGPSNFITNGQHTLVYEMYENGGGATYGLSWAGILTSAPSLSLNATTPVASGGSTTLTWTVSSATSCTASGGTPDWNTPSAKSFADGTYNQVIPMIIDTSFTLTCQNPTGPTVASVNVLMEPVEYSITIVPSQGGKVTSNIGGINCGTTCKNVYSKDAIVTLTPVQNSATWKFIRWTGACAGLQQGLDNHCDVLVNGAKNTTAIFAPKPRYIEF